MAEVDVQVNLRPSLIEHIILFVTMRQGSTETNDEYLDMFNCRVQNLILAGVEQIIFSLKNMDTSGAIDTL